MIMRVFVPTWLAKECHKDQAPRIERREQSRDDEHPEGIAPCRARKGAFNDGIL